jgi:indolepyruvate ferredoxin oxidoreductase
MRAARGLRGTRLDPFVYAGVGGEELALIGWYRDLLEQAMDGLSPATYRTAVAIAELPDLIRGYEEIKLRSVAKAKGQAEGLVRRLRQPEPVELIELELA